jgi:hypothetical protein
MAITVDTIQLKFNVKPSYEQQEMHPAAPLIRKIPESFK